MNKNQFEVKSMKDFRQGQIRAIKNQVEFFDTQEINFQTNEKRSEKSIRAKNRLPSLDLKMSIREFLELKKHIFLQNLTHKYKNEAMTDMKYNILFEEKQLLEKIEDFNQTTKMITTQLNDCKKKVNLTNNEVAILEVRRNELQKDLKETENKIYLSEGDLKTARERFNELESYKNFVNLVLSQFNQNFDEQKWRESVGVLTIRNRSLIKSTFLTEGDPLITKNALQNNLKRYSFGRKESDFQEVVENIEGNAFKLHNFLQNEEGLWQNKNGLTLSQLTFFENQKQALETRLNLLKKEEKLFLDLIKNKQANLEEISVQNENQKQTSKIQILNQKLSIQFSSELNKYQSSSFELLISKIQSMVKKCGIKFIPETDAVSYLKIIELIFERLKIENSVIRQNNSSILYKILKELNVFNKKSSGKMEESVVYYKQTCTNKNAHSIKRFSVRKERLPQIKSTVYLKATSSISNLLQKKDSKENDFFY